MTEQLQLLGVAHRNESLWPFWRESLLRWPGDFLRFRQHRASTGWSMVTQDFMYARLLLKDGQISRSLFRRYFLLNLRVQRLEREYWKSLSS